MIFLSDQVSPASFWLAGFLALGIPIALIINLVLFFIALRMKRKSKWFFLATLLIGLPHLNRTIAFSKLNNLSEGNSLKVLSYNARVFNLYQFLNDGDKNNESKSMIDWLIRQDVDVIAIQEYYEDKGSEVFNVSEKMANHGFVYSNVISRRTVEEGVVFGLATFSKYPIVQKKEVLFENNKSNKAGCVKIQKDGEVFNVYNCHLESMNIDTKHIFETNVKDEEVKKHKVRLFQKLKKGFVHRAEQAELVLKSSLENNSRTIICGDFNDIPYSYTYSLFLKDYNNAFERGGRGFGFTYNHNSLFFLRIDNQFFSKDLSIASFRTLKDVSYSDHFPIVSEYFLSND